jgi:cell division protein FtsX
VPDGAGVGLPVGRVVGAVVGAVVASGALLLLTRFLVLDWLKDNLKFFNYVQMHDAYLVVPWLFLIAIVLAGVSAYLSLLRYLKV